MNFMTEFVSQGTAALIPALWIPGAALKATPKVPDWLIPYLLTAAGMALAAALGAASAPLVENLLRGILAAGLAVYGDQLAKQAREREG